MNDKLKQGNVITSPFSGRSRKVSTNLYVFCFTPLYPRFVLNVMCLFLAVGGIVLQMFNWTTTGMVIYVIAGLFAFLVNMFWSPEYYTFVLRWQIRKLMQSKWMVKRADKLVLERLCYDKI